MTSMPTFLRTLIAPRPRSASWPGEDVSSRPDSMMIKSLLRLWLAAFLILVASAALLLTDQERPRVASGSSRTWKIGLAAYSQSTNLEAAIEGFRRGLKEDSLVGSLARTSKATSLELQA